MLFRVASFILMLSSVYAYGQGAHEEDTAPNLPYSSRSYPLYSTFVEEKNNARTALTGVGNKILISPLDSFAYVPEIGEGVFDQIRRDALTKTEPPMYPEAFVISSGLDNETTDWAKEKLGTDEVIEYTVPMPEGNVVDIELTIVSSKPLLETQAMVMCHEIEKGSFTCHFSDKGDKVEVTVAPNNDNKKKEVLWVACHEGMGCHVANALDRIYVVAEKEVHTNVRGSI